MPTNSELAKKLSGGAITKREYDRLMAMPHKDRYKNKEMKKRSGAAVTSKEAKAMKGIPEHKTTMKPTPAKMKAYAKGMRQHIMNTGSKKKSYSTGGTSGGGSVGSM